MIQKIEPFNPNGEQLTACSGLMIVCRLGNALPSSSSITGWSIKVSPLFFTGSSTRVFFYQTTDCSQVYEPIPLEKTMVFKSSIYVKGLVFFLKVIVVMIPKENVELVRL